MNIEEQYAVLRLLIKKEIFTLDEFLEEVSEAKKFRKVLSSILPVEENHIKALEVRDAYLEYGEIKELPEKVITFRDESDG